MIKDKGFVAYFRRRLPTSMERCLQIADDEMVKQIVKEIRSSARIFSLFTGVPYNGIVYRRWGHPNG